MKARPVISTLLLALSLLALMAGTACSLLSSNGEHKDAKSSAAQNVQESPAVKQARQELEDANNKLKQEVANEKQIGIKLQEARANEEKASPEKKKEKHKIVTDFEQAAANANGNVANANIGVQEAQKRVEEAKRSAGAGFENTNSQAGGDNGSGGGLLASLPNLSTVLVIFCSLLILGALIYIAKQLIDGSRARTEAYFAGMKRRQDEHASKTREALVTLNNRMAELQSEIRDLRRSLQDDNRAILDGVRRAGASSAAYAGSSSGYAAQSPRFEKEEPAFPAAAEDYLNRNRRSAVVVKPDFQNGILVQDAEGQGEFMLVRDHSAPDELLYVIPRTGYFQTKQDFLTYYAKYYECARPSAGTVWIVQPAVVDRVSGGWSLREKGELEVR